MVETVRKIFPTELNPSTMYQDVVGQILKFIQDEKVTVKFFDRGVERAVIPDITKYTGKLVKSGSNFVPTEIEVHFENGTVQRAIYKHGQLVKLGFKGREVEWWD